MFFLKTRCERVFTPLNMVYCFTMARQSKAQQLGLENTIIEIWDDGRKSIDETTALINKQLKDAGVDVSFNHQNIRRVVRNRKQQLKKLRDKIYTAKVMGEMLQGKSTLEITETALRGIEDDLIEQLQTLSTSEISDPERLIFLIDKLANTRLKLERSRLDNEHILENAKTEIKAQLQKTIQNDKVLLARLFKIVDGDRKSTRLNSSHWTLSRMPSSA